MNQPLLYNRQPPRPAWGVRVDPRKTLSTSEPIVAAPLPTQVQLPLELGPERRAQAVVAPGDYVYTGQPVARLETGARNVDHSRPGATWSARRFRVGSLRFARARFPVPARGSQNAS